MSTAFLYGRRQNIVLPLADVLWVYRHDLKLLWAKRTVVELLTYDGRSITLRLERGGSRRMADAIVQAVAARNPEALVGLNRENQRLYSQQVPHAKRKRVWATAAGIGGGVLGYAIARVLYACCCRKQRSPALRTGLCAEKAPLSGGAFLFSRWCGRSSCRFSAYVRPGGPGRRVCSCGYTRRYGHPPYG